MSLDNQKGLDAINGRGFTEDRARLPGGRQPGRCGGTVLALSKGFHAVHVHGHGTVGLYRVSR